MSDGTAPQHKIRFYLSGKKISAKVLPIVVFPPLGGKYHDPCFCIDWHLHGNDRWGYSADHGTILVDRTGQLYRRRHANCRHSCSFCSPCDENQPAQSRRPPDARRHATRGTLTLRALPSASPDPESDAGHWRAVRRSNFFEDVLFINKNDASRPLRMFWKRQPTLD